VVDPIVTEIALSHFGGLLAAILHISVPWNFVKFTLILAWLDLLTGTSAGKAFCRINPNDSICLFYNGLERARLQAGRVIAMPALVFEKKPVELRIRVLDKLRHRQICG